MSYQALYRKWRPDNFEDVKGQDHIVTTLKNQINADRIGHAYLFCGTRGTGKTSVAKIFAKAVNCEHPVNGSPCGECPTCRNIVHGNTPEEVVRDEEGMQTMRLLGKNMAWLVKSIDAAKKQGVELPCGEDKIKTNFIR